MEEEKKDMLDETLERLIKKLEAGNMTDGERKSLTEMIDKLYKTKVDRDVAMKKIEVEQTTNEERLKFDKEADKKRRTIEYMNLGLRFASTAANIAFGVWSMTKGYEFETTGKPISTTFKEARNIVYRTIEKMIGK